MFPSLLSKLPSSAQSSSRRSTRHVRQRRQVFQRFSEASPPRVRRPIANNAPPSLTNPSRQRRPGPVPSPASRGRPQVVSLLNVQPTAGSRSSRPSIATTHSPHAFSHNIPQHAYSNNRHSPYFSHPSFLSLAHVEAMRFPQATHYPPQGAHPPRTYMPYIPLPSRVGVSIPPPGYPYPPPLVPYNGTQQFPPFSTPVSPFIPSQCPPEWVPVLFQQRRDFPVSAFQTSLTPISSISPVHTQPSESSESLAAPPPAPSAAADVPVVDGERRMFSSAPVPSPKERSLDVPVRPSSAPAVFPAPAPATATAPHDACSRPAVPVTQCLDANALGGPDLPNSRTAGRRHKQ